MSKAPRCPITVWGRVWKGAEVGGWTKPQYHQCSKAGSYDGFCYVHARRRGGAARVSAIERAIKLLRANGYGIVTPRSLSMLGPIVPPG